jgi:hypothetical protein
VVVLEFLEHQVRQARLVHLELPVRLEHLVKLALELLEPLELLVSKERTAHQEHLALLD